MYVILAKLKLPKGTKGKSNEIKLILEKRHPVNIPSEYNNQKLWLLLVVIMGFKPDRIEIFDSFNLDSGAARARNVLCAFFDRGLNFNPIREHRWDLGP